MEEETGVREKMRRLNETGVEARAFGSFKKFKEDGTAEDELEEKLEARSKAKKEQASIGQLTVFQT